MRHTVHSQVMRLHFNNHASLVQLAGLLADDLIPFLFETDSGESVLCFKYDNCPDHLQWVIDEFITWGDASLTPFVCFAR